MKKNDQKMEIATFRFGVIAEFVTGVRLIYGEKERLIKEKTSRHWKIPCSEKSIVTRSTLLKWVSDYKKAGCRIEGLFPKDRSDKGSYRSLDITLQMAIKAIKQEKPKLTGVALVNELKHRKVIGHSEQISLSVLYRYLQTENLIGSKSVVDRRSFEAEYPNELWQSDVMHGPHVRDKLGKKKKSYLAAIIDDHSRLIVHAQFYLSERMDDFKDCLKQAIEKRGLPQKLYTDNGSCFKALNIEQITSCLGIALRFAKPYTPQGKGKIERWFGTIRSSFLPPLPDKIFSLEGLNERLIDWVNEYNNRIHSSTQSTPLQRFKANLQCVRPAPKNLIDYFRLIEFRTVRKDRTIQLNGSRFEAPVADLIDRKIELRFHRETPFEIEVFFEGRSYGEALILNKNVNFKVGRNNRLQATPITTTPNSGELFTTKNTGEKK